MADILILEFDGIGPTEYQAVNAELNIDMNTGVGDWPDGLLMHAGGPADSGAFFVTEAWESREQQEAFMHGALGAALAAGGVTSAPKVTWVSAIAYQTVTV